MIANSIKIFLLTICSLFLGCNNANEIEKIERLEELNKELSRINKHYKNEYLIIDDQRLNDKLFNDSTNYTSHFIVYYDTDCFSCFEDLKKWETLLPIFKNYKINFKFILASKKETELIKSLKEVNIQESSIVILNKATKLLERYDYLGNRAYNTILLDKEKKIQFIGSPLYSKNLTKHYTNLIKKEINVSN